MSQFSDLHSYGYSNSQIRKLKRRQETLDSIAKPKTKEPLIKSNMSPREKALWANLSRKPDPSDNFPD